MWQWTLEVCPSEDRLPKSMGTNVLCLRPASPTASQSELFVTTSSEDLGSLEYYITTEKKERALKYVDFVDLVCNFIARGCRAWRPWSRVFRLCWPYCPHRPQWIQRTIWTWTTFLACHPITGSSSSSSSCCCCCCCCCCFRPVFLPLLWREVSRISPTVLQRNDHGPVFRSLCGVAPWRPFQDLKKRVSWVVTFAFFFFLRQTCFLLLFVRTCTKMLRMSRLK